jgi:hypothetical protein
MNDWVAGNEGYTPSLQWVCWGRNGGLMFRVSIRIGILNETGHTLQDVDVVQVQTPQTMFHGIKNVLREYELATSWPPGKNGKI